MNEESGLNDHGNDGLYGHCVVNMDQLSAISTLAACSDKNIIIHVNKRTRASCVISFCLNNHETFNQIWLVNVGSAS